MDTSTDLDGVLHTLEGPELYRRNIFGITGLPVDATPSQIRRRREEAVLESRLNPQADGEAIRSAFEAVRDPVARLTHELLWTWAPAEHREAVAAEYRGPHQAGSAEADRLDELWRIGLAGWAAVFEKPESWSYAKERVAQIDDPRLTTGTVRRLREYLPRHIAAVTADLAVRAASLGAEAADRLVELLDESPLSDDAVDVALREAVRPSEKQVSSACEQTRDALQAKPETAEQLAEDLLAKVAEPIVVVEALLGEQDELATALNDDVALTVNLCAVTLHETAKRSNVAMRLLSEARPYARTSRTIELIAENTDIIGLSELTREMRRFCDKGKVQSADRRRRALMRVLPEGEAKNALRSLPANDRRVGADVLHIPTVDNVFGIGTRFVNTYRRHDEFRYTATYVITLLWIPLIPLSAYLYSNNRFYAKVPLRPAARWWRFFLLTTALGVALAAVFAGTPSEKRLTILGVYAIFLVLVGFRRLWLHVWALGKVDR